MKISDRKEQILQAVVDSYIVSCEPISSKEIHSKHFPSISSATIRNELAALEEMGYLTQPHTSSGRVPTAEAYRLYVDKLMPKHSLTKSELQIVNQYFEKKVTDIDEILKNTAKVISEITNLTSVAVIPNITNAIINNIKIVKVTPSLALVIIVTNLGILKDGCIEVKSELDDNYFADASNFITSAYKGHKISEILDPDNEIIKQVTKEYKQILLAIASLIEHYSQEGKPDNIVFEGSSKLLNQPEYANVEKAKAMLEVLDGKEHLTPVFDKKQGDVNINIRIANENELQEGLPECAIVTASYTVNGVNIGDAGVIGPMRMDYGKVISVLDYIGKTLNILPEGKGDRVNERKEEK